MALPKKGFRKIEVLGEVFLWRVRKKISGEERHNDDLGIPIQHTSGGQLLIADLGYGRSYGYGRVSLVSITPAIIKKYILEAIDLGWQYHTVGKPVCIRNGKFTTDTRW